MDVEPMTLQACLRGQPPSEIPSDSADEADGEKGRALATAVSETGMPTNSISDRHGIF